MFENLEAMVRRLEQQLLAVQRGEEDERQWRLAVAAQLPQETLDAFKAIHETIRMQARSDQGLDRS